MRRQFTEQEIINSVARAYTYTEAAANLDIPGQIGTIKYWISQYDIDISHFNPHKHREATFIEKICPVCNNMFKVNDSAREHQQQTCSYSCSNTFTPRKKKSTTKTQQFRKKPEGEKLTKTQRPRKKRTCNWCGITSSYRITCSDKCKHEKLLYKSLKYFTFNDNLIGTNDVHDEVERVKDLLISEYFTNKLSLPAICEKYNYPDHGTLGAFMKRSVVDSLRDASEAGRNGYAQGRCISGTAPQYKSGVHTTWNGKEVTYRSSYELEFYQLLDDEQVDYLVECFRVPYFDTQTSVNRTAIPDVYIPSTNTIIEIKSSYTYDEQNMRDRFKKFQQLGYNTKLWLDKEFIDQFTQV